MGTVGIALAGLVALGFAFLALSERDKWVRLLCGLIAGCGAVMFGGSLLLSPAVTVDSVAVAAPISWPRPAPTAPPIEPATWMLDDVAAQHYEAPATHEDVAAMAPVAAPEPTRSHDPADPNFAANDPVGYSMWILDNKVQTVDRAPLDHITGIFRNMWYSFRDIFLYRYVQ